jgi:hypothetical protein
MSHDAPHPRLRSGEAPEAPDVGPRARIEEPEASPGIWDNKENVGRLLRVLYVVCGGLVIADFIVHRHLEHPWEGLPAFYPLYGFVGIVLLVLVAKVLRAVVMRPEDHYDA